MGILTTERGGRQEMFTRTPSMTMARKSLNIQPDPTTERSNSWVNFRKTNRRQAKPPFKNHRIRRQYQAKQLDNGQRVALTPKLYKAGSGGIGNRRASSSTRHLESPQPFMTMMTRFPENYTVELWGSATLALLSPEALDSIFVLLLTQTYVTNPCKLPHLTLCTVLQWKGIS